MCASLPPVRSSDGHNVGLPRIARSSVIASLVALSLGILIAADSPPPSHPPAAVLSPASSSPKTRPAPTAPSAENGTDNRSKSATKTPKRGVASGEPSIQSKAKSDRLKPKSSFLNPPGGLGSIRYGSDDLNWSEIPPWRQTSFFGIRARGQFFIYVVDGSGSMIDDDRFPRATIELRRSVFALQPPQRFEVIFYNERPTPMPGGPVPRPADLKSRAALIQWLRLIEPEGETNPTPALAQAIALKPDAIFFLSDGVLPEGTVESVAKLNTRKIPIHCIDLAGGLGGDQLRRIAKANAGEYASRAGSLHAAP